MALSTLFGARVLAAMLAIPACCGAAEPASSDTPRDYSHSMAVNISGQQGVVQLRLPSDVYLHARSPELADVRVFDASGAPLPFALQHAPAQTRISHRALTARIFPLMDGATRADQQLDLDINTGPDGRLLSVKVRPDGQRGHSDAPAHLSGLVLDLREGAATGRDDASPLIDALRFTLPAGTRAYRGEVWVESSDDLKHWDALGAVELNWLVNNATETLESDRLDFAPRRFRYARLRWRAGEPIAFGAISAESPSQTELAAPTVQLLLAPLAGHEPRDLLYQAPLGIVAQKIGLQFSEQNVVLPVTIGSYRELPPRQFGQPTHWQFEPLLRTTFYQITQQGQTRASADVAVGPIPTTQWVLRTDTPSATKPTLRLVWSPATLVFLANGRAPYTLAFGRDKAPAKALDVTQVAPGFSAEEIANVEQATVGALRAQADFKAGEDSALKTATQSSRQRALALWGVLLAGVALLAFMVWRLMQQMKSPPKPPDA